MRTFFFFSSRRRHTRCSRDWSSDVCSSDLGAREQHHDFIAVGLDHLATGGFRSVAHPLDAARDHLERRGVTRDRKSTRLNSSHGYISYAVFCLKKKKKSRIELQEHEHAVTGQL